MYREWLEQGIPEIQEIQRRLGKIFSREIDINGYILREMGAKTVFVMLYCFCVDGEQWIRPATITCMTDEQAKKQEQKERTRWLSLNQSSKAPRDIPNRWYKPNTREPIRDETIREMVRLNAVIERQSLPTTSPKPRYSLQSEFAELFNPNLEGKELDEAIEGWKSFFLSQSLLARTALAKRLVTQASEGVLIMLPNGETRKMAAGLSSELTKAVVENFAKNFMKEPAVLLISESARKLLIRDEELCRAIGLKIEVAEALPDVILADLGTNPPILIFAECVASDGPVNERRKGELLKIAKEANYQEENCAYVTVFRDRSDSVSRRLSPSVAWGTFIWHASEPEDIIYLRGSSANKTSIDELMKA